MNPIHLPQKKLYVGKKRICRPMVNRRDQELLRWACAVKPGDYIATCEGFNRKVASVEPVWANVGKWRHDNPNNHWFLYEVEFIDSHGCRHICPGGGCALPKETPEQVSKYLTEFYQWVVTDRPEWSDEKDLQYAQKVLGYVAQDKAIVDEFGEIIPELAKRNVDELG